ncbi:phospholipase A2 inhibitor and Ly6/PLAUR domain-containing protein [Cephus cinctus]|uniref:Phospholipase A2 inhibitor and Ly6/PLAUR domain-containing protein n=1 Tax=Cephus cinctus TaxID=211228 RepID=A0AAJ7FRT5_CEPCN|nr:phospholipase A2 inhibitor and Ly6/PLAUR domain-containing protein [Cephus cinctus]
MDKPYRLFCILLVLFVSNLSNALECYVCTEQEGNTEKCLNTIKTCEQGEDACLTDIKWGSTPYWHHGAKKQYYISKRCVAKNECERIRAKTMDDCTYVWYQDWHCSDCCQGDRCNYYIFSHGTRSLAGPFIVLIAALVPLLGNWNVQ